jgi:hypothetical protein
MAGSAPATSLGVTGCLSQTNGRAGLRPVVPERQAVAGALLGEEPLVKLAVLLDAQRALRQDAAVSWARRRRLVVGHGGRHLSGTDVTEEGSKHSCVPVQNPAGGKDARIVLYNGSCSVVGRHFSYIRTCRRWGQQSASWARRQRLLVVGHGGRHLSGTDVTQEGSKRRQVIEIHRLRI